MWAVHLDADGAVAGWEERGPDWRGFATGGAKVLFRLGRPDALRLCVTEAAIDAMSLGSRVLSSSRPPTTTNKATSMPTACSDWRRKLGAALIAFALWRTTGTPI